jgi:hypothetical protein
LICFIELNDVFAPGVTGCALGALFVSLERALVSAAAGLNMANSAAAIVMAELRKKRRRSLLTWSELTWSDISLPPIWINCCSLSYFLSPALCCIPSGFIEWTPCPSNSLLRISDGIDRDQRITPDAWRRNNWTIVLAIPWHESRAEGAGPAFALTTEASQHSRNQNFRFDFS